MMKPRFVCAALASALLVSAVDAAPKAANTSARHAEALHFARGATMLDKRDTISGSQHRFYTLKMKAGQHLRISATTTSRSRSAMVPMIFVTPPCGQYDGAKTATYAEKSSHVGDYRIEVAANQMASNATQGAFVLHVEAR